MDYDLTDIKDYERVCLDRDGDLTPITEQIILYTKKCGVPWLTAETAEEFLTRVEMVADIAGEPLNTPEGLPYRITLEDVVQHLGLTTSAEALTAPQFYRKLLRYQRARAQESVEEQKEALHPTS